MIRIDGLRYRSLAVPSLAIPPGWTSVIGPNGSGKTSLLRLIAGITLPESGSVLIDGIPPRDTGIGWVNEFPDRNMLFGTAADEVASPLRFRHLPGPEIRTRTGSAMEETGIMALADRPVRDLSGGEKVLVALAAALVVRPAALILDEYDSHLDHSRICQTLQAIRKIPVRYVIRCTQDMDTALQSDYLLFLGDGRIRYSGIPSAVFAALEGTPFYPFPYEVPP